MKIIETLRELSQSILEEGNNNKVMERLKDVVMDAVIYFHRYHAKHDRTDALKRAIESMDDIKVMLRVAVDLKCITYDKYKMYEDQAHQMVKMMVSELNITFGSRKAVAERSLGR